MLILFKRGQSAMDEMIVVEDVCKTYVLFEKDWKILQWVFTHKGYQSKREVLQHISFTVKNGEVVGLIGVNGAGKSTLMKMIAGITFPTTGHVQVNGKIGSLINLSAGFNPDYTGRRNIYYKGTIMGMSKSSIDNVIHDIEEFVDLGEYFDKPVRMYSSGMSARLGFALAVYCNPDILIVDEVLAVGDKSFQNKSRAKITELFNAGKAVIFSSHSDTLIQQFCNRVIYIRDGRIAYDGEVAGGLDLYNEDISRKRNKKTH